MIFPTVHMNGTSRADLVDGLLDARSAVVAAMGAIRAVYPNGRDYYPQGPDALRAAEKEYDERLTTLNRIANDLLLLAGHCQDS